MNSSNLPRRSLLFIFSFVLSATLTGCTDGMLAPAPEKGSEKTPSSDAKLAEHRVSPHALLTGSRTKRAHRPSSGGFASPLFGLGTAPNQDILVADAGAGVSTLSGDTEVPLPGVTDVGALGRGALWATKGLTGNPGDDTGQALYRASKGNTRLIADLFAFESTNNPDGADLIDSNPFDVEPVSGRTAVVADAGANDLLRVDNQGNIEVLAVFPEERVSIANLQSLVCPNAPEDDPPGFCALPSSTEFPAQPVPTSVAVGPDGYYYVGELKGFPAPTGESNIWKVAPDASGAQCGSSPKCTKVFDGGFTSIIDLRFGPGGTLHVAELDENSWFAVEIGSIAGGTINACDVDAKTCSEVASGIPILTAITFENDGTLWATKNALLGSAEVVKINP